MKHLSIKHQLGTYPIHIEKGCVAKINELLSSHKISLNNRSVFILTDETVEKLYLEKILQDFPTARVISVPTGEKSKSFEQLETICNQLLEMGVKRSSLIIALGGGVVGDLAGFVASIIMRGIDFVQIPTSLLAQIDSSVGGKTGINTAYGKNLVGSFYQPQAVYIDPDFLSTLPKNQLLAGYAEIVKYALIHKPDFFVWLQENASKLLDNNQEAVEHALYESCASKADIVEQDEKEKTGARMLLNLGHSFGHAIEALMSYEGILHGEAVAIGTCMAMDLSEYMQLMSKNEVDQVKNHFMQIGLPTELPKAMVDQQQAGAFVDLFLQTMAKDKKNLEDGYTLILMKGIGEGFVNHNTPREKIETIVKQYSDRLYS